MEKPTEPSQSESSSEDKERRERVLEHSIPGLFCLSYSHIGSSHIEQGKPNQDYSSIQSNSDTLFVAVADGLGSCAFSDVGSQLVASRITEKMRDSVSRSLSESVEMSKDRVLFKAGPLKLAVQHKSKEIVKHPLAKLDEQTFKAAFIRAVEDVRSELSDLSSKKNLASTDENKSDAGRARNSKGAVTKGTKEDFASTCLFAMTDGKKVFCSHVGDGGIYIVCQTTSELIVEPTKGEALNETIPVTHDEWKDYLKTKVFEVPPQALFLCLMTDGFAENISKNNPNLFFQRIVSEAKEKKRADFVTWLAELNDYYESRGFSDDDKTATFIVLNSLFQEDLQ